MANPPRAAMSFEAVVEWALPGALSLASPCPPTISQWPTVATSFLGREKIVQHPHAGLLPSAKFRARSHCGNRLRTVGLNCMRKRIIGTQTAAESGSSEAWLDLEAIADVELTSENEAYPVEAAFSADSGAGWKAATNGRQTIRLIFKQPQRVRWIRLEFIESDVERSQEFVLHYAEENSAVLREIIRQQWTFSPRGSTSEIEEYSIDVHRVRLLQLTIDPDRGRDKEVATLRRWRIA